MSVREITSSTGTPAAEHEIDTALVAALLADQHPDLAHLPLQFVDAGWDNVMYRLGEDLAVRIPRRALGAALVLNEQRWLPEIAVHLPLPVPLPLRIGRPAAGYPWSWSVIPWLHGDLHPRNILVDNGSITGIIDWGDITSGDPATDLASIWMLFADRPARQEAITAYGALSEATLQRARGWATLFGVMLLDTGLVDNPQHAIMGECILCCLDEEM